MMKKCLLVYFIVTLTLMYLCSCDEDDKTSLNKGNQTNQTRTSHPWELSPPIDPILQGDTHERVKPAGEPEPTDVDEDNPRDTPPPVIYGEEIEITEAKKVILLVAGQNVVDRVVADYNPDPQACDFRVVDKDAARMTIDPSIHHWRVNADNNMRNAWSGLVQKYLSEPFVKKDWTLIAMRATSKAAIRQMMVAIKERLNPDAFMFQYFGHGSFWTGEYANPANPMAPVPPYLELCPYKPQQIPVKEQQTGKWCTAYMESNIDRGRDDSGFDARYYLYELGNDLYDLFSRFEKKTILVVDGCDLAPALDLATPKHIKVLVSQKFRQTETSMALFSVGFATAVTPESFELWHSAMQGALDAGNKAVRNAVPKQIGAMTPQLSLPKQNNP